MVCLSFRGNRSVEIVWDFDVWVVLLLALGEGHSCDLHHLVFGNSPPLHLPSVQVNYHSDLIA